VKTDSSSLSFKRQLQKRDQIRLQEDWKDGRPVAYIPDTIKHYPMFAQFLSPLSNVSVQSWKIQLNKKHMVGL